MIRGRHIAAARGSDGMFNTLVKFKAGTTQIGPGLAQSWDISRDGTEYTFHLGPGAVLVIR